MAVVTKPLMLDETGQAIVDAIRGIGLGYYVVVNINNPSWGRITGGGLYPPLAEVTVVAIPYSNYGFLCWRDASGNILSTDLEYRFMPSGNVVLQADFYQLRDYEIVTWARGTDLQLKTMIEAADAGEIVLTDYWRVGDTRTVHLTAMPTTSEDIPDATFEAHAEQDVEFVILDGEEKNRMQVVEGETFHFYVGMKDCLNETMPNEGGDYRYNVSKRAAWCKYIFPASLPQVFRTLLKNAIFIDSAGNEFVSEITMYSTRMVANYETYPFSTDVYGNYLEYYKTTEHRIKKANNAATSYFTTTRFGNYGFQGVNTAGVPTLWAGDGLTVMGVI